MGLPILLTIAHMTTGGEAWKLQVREPGILAAGSEEKDREQTESAQRAARLLPFGRDQGADCQISVDPKR